MRLEEFDYELPEEAIAQQARPRGESRLLRIHPTGSFEHHNFRALASLLEPGDLLVVNDSKVLPARLFGQTVAGGRVEILLAERLDTRLWSALGRPGRKLRPGARITFAPGLEGRVLELENAGGKRTVEFSEPVEPWLERIGETPLPPYIRRDSTREDRERYQTVFAREPGSVAAPTAGLHFDGRLLKELDRAGIGLATITLHVGPGTFKPVTSVLVHEHRMDREPFTIPERTAELLLATRARGGRIIAVGTTVVRTLESAALAGGGTVPAGSGSTDLFIYPGFRFQIVDLLLTNFHLPRSTLLLLVCAFGGRERVLAAYREALARGYRFLSYGDAMLVPRAA